MGINDLRCAYSPPVDFLALREELRKLREQSDFTLDELAVSSGLNRATIHAIENIKREPDLKPELETVERLVVAMGLTLSEFFARIEGLNVSPERGTTSILNPQGGEEHVRGGVPGGGGVPDAFVQSAMLTAIADTLAERFDAAIDRLIEAREQTATARLPRPVRAAGGRKARG